MSKLLSLKRYTSKEVKDKLNEKFGLPDSACESLLYPYIKADILNDSCYVFDYCESKIDSGYGENYILQKCKEKGISKEILCSEEISSLFKKQKEILPILISKQNKAKKNQTIEQRKKSIYQFLIRRGYKTEDVQKSLLCFYSSLSDDEKQEEAVHRKVLLKKEAEKCYNLLVHKSIPADKKKDIFLKKLLSKGYRYEEVKPLLKEYAFHD